MPEARIIIIGAGPTGLGAAWRLQELGYGNWAVYEKNDHVGGLATSFVDEKGFTWDVGGHVLFSHYRYFDDLVEKLLNGAYLEHLRESWIRIFDTWVPYPFQNNIRYLPKDKLYECMAGLIDADRRCRPSDNFHDWMFSVFGSGILKYFMEPYNQKVWAYPLREMSQDWIAERVSVVDVKRILKNVIHERDDTGWGPNNKFIFPLRGGTGEIFRRFVPYIKGHLFLEKGVTSINPGNKTIRFQDWEEDCYDMLINTMPLDLLLRRLEDGNAVLPALQEKASTLKHTNGIIVGLGFEQKINNDRGWMYFPESNNPCYRITNFSNYSPNNVPGGDTGRYYSLMCEISYSDYRQADKEGILDKTIEGLIASGLISGNDTKKIVTRYVRDVPYTYPVPTLGRDHILKSVQPYLESMDIYSRGRFGGWKYEVGNMDHSVMQGVEAVDRILLEKPEVTYRQ